MKAYLATGWNNPHAKKIKDQLSRAGLTVYHFLDSGLELDYNKIVPNLRSMVGHGQSKYLRDPVIGRAAICNLNELMASNIFVIAEPTGKGSQMEYGFAYAAQIPTILYVTPEYELGVMDFWHQHIVHNEAELNLALERIRL